LAIASCDESTLRGYDAKEVCNGTGLGSTCFTTEGTLTTVALDESSCIVLTLHAKQTEVSTRLNFHERGGMSREQALQFDPSLDWNFPPDNEIAFTNALKAGLIIDLKAGTRVQMNPLMFAENGHLVEPYPATGPS
jgi:hypothetical protein